MEQTFGQWVRAQRQARGWTITRCAERAGMKWQAWQRQENDGPKRRDGSPSQPARQTVEKIARALEIPVGEAMCAAGYLYGLPPNAIFIPAGGTPIGTNAQGQPSMEVFAELARMQAQINQILDLLLEVKAKLERQDSINNSSEK